MKKLLLLLAVVVAFTCTSVAQYGTGGASQSSEQTTSKSKSKKAAASDETGGGKAKKDATLTGCLSKEADASGNLTLTNGKYKKGVVVEPADKMKGHEGHQVQLTGQWSPDKKKFEVASMKHISEICEAATGGGAAKKEKKDKAMSEKPPK